jgi:epoxyqueuosine reductase
VKQLIRNMAAEIGFDLCGFARIEPVPHGDFVRNWLADGHAGTMAYIANGLAKRLDPTLLLDGARSIISLGVRYTPPPLPPIDWREELRGRIAAYALGADYHRTIKRQLKQLAARIAAERPDTGMRPYVDTGPVLEREWAAAGGVGWFGKNTNILHREHGSWFFLAELVTTLELEPDTPTPDHCGTCVRCLDLCPTDALAPGYVLDGRRCISYWTIEHRDAIPTEFRPRMENWVFGCDICQEVCPWNEKLARGASLQENDELTPFLPELMTLDEGGFRRRFRGTAVLRTKREGLLRNAAVVLGNTRNPLALPALGDALERDRSALVRCHAAWALGRIGGPAARTRLEGSRRREAEANVRAEIDAALNRI